MASVPPPQGMSEVDYDAIEAAVTETVRGRWFLSEFARRNRLAETRQLLDAMARLETAVATGQNALPSADPSIRLLIQRIKEVAGQLGAVAGEMRAAGVEHHLVEAVDSQARAVAGMMRSATPAVATAPKPSQISEAPKPAPAPMPRLPRAEYPPTPAASASRLPESARDDPRLAAFSELEGMSPAKKLALFT